MTKEDGIIFDFDNTLVATQDFILTHLEKTCVRLGLTPPALDKIQNKLQQNPPFEKIFTDLFGVDGERILTAYRENAMETPYTETPGGNLFVRTMFDQKVPMVIVSNRVNKLEERLVQAGYNPINFLAILKAEPPKPDRKAYDGAVAKLLENGSERLKITIIGDHADDYLACPGDLRPNFIAVLTGLTKAEEFEKVGVSIKNIWQKLEAQRLSII